MSKPSRPMLWDDPNKFAPPASLELHDGAAIVRGYQDFLLTQRTITPLANDPKLARKYELLRPYLSPRYLAHRRVLDLGASAGFFCFAALQNGATGAIAADIDPQYLEMTRRTAQATQIANLRVVESNVAEITDTADAVFALALIHWIYSCTAILGSLDRVIERLARLTGYMLIVEWIDASDPAIQSFGHLDFNRDELLAPYTKEHFERALSRHFARWERIGEVNATRSLYAAFTTPHELDLSGTLPFICPIESLISSRILATIDDLPYLSRVYDNGNAIVKQTTLDLAHHEAEALARLLSPYFPRVLAREQDETSSVVIMEKIIGQALESARDEIVASDESFKQFCAHCLRLLDELRMAGIVHRDIRAANMLYRDHKPVLLDFGWCEIDERQDLIPLGLGLESRPPDGTFCDVYSMGCVLKWLAGNQRGDFDLLFDLMCEPETELRVRDLATLSAVLEAIDPANLERGVRP